MKILDLRGKLLKTVMLEIAEQNPEHFFPYCISQGILYQLVENEDSENWELFATEIDTVR